MQNKRVQIWPVEMNEMFRFRDGLDWVSVAGRRYVMVDSGKRAQCALGPFGQRHCLAFNVLIVLQRTYVYHDLICGTIWHVIDVYGDFLMYAVEGAVHACSWEIVMWRPLLYHSLKRLQ